MLKSRLSRECYSIMNIFRFDYSELGTNASLAKDEKLMNVKTANTKNHYLLKVLSVLVGIVTCYYLISNAFPKLIPTEEAYGSYYFSRVFWVFPHVVLGIVATVVGPFQFIPKIRNTYLKFHRQLGRVYIITTVLAGISGMYMAATSDVNLTYMVGLFMLGFAWVTTSLMALISIKNRKVDLHKEWMIRSYIVTLAFTTYRFGDDILSALEVGTGNDIAALMSWACWAIPLFIGELFIQGNKIKKSATV